ncbi:N-acetyltransferase, partial [Streptomyces sp. NPDC059810]
GGAAPTGAPGGIPPPLGGPRAPRGTAGGGGRPPRAAPPAAATGLGLLVLDTQTDSPAERLYRGTGWTAAGTIPDFAADPAGVLRATTLYYKRLG